MIPSICTTNGKGRFLTKLLTFSLFWTLVIYVVFQFRTLSIDVPVPHLNGRFLLQKSLDQLTRHADSTTESSDLEPSVDKRPSLSEDNLIDDIQKRMPNLPIVYWNKNKNTPMGFNNTCAR